MRVTAALIPASSTTVPAPVYREDPRRVGIAAGMMTVAASVPAGLAGCAAHMASSASSSDMRRTSMSGSQSEN